MANLFNYNVLLNQAFQKAQNIRDPRSIRQEYIHYGKSDISSNHVVTIGGASYKTYSAMVNMTHEITFECLKVTLFYLFKHYGHECTMVDGGQLSSDVRFAFMDKKNSLLLLFKEPLDDFVVVTSDFISAEINDYKKRFNVKECGIVYLMYEKADKQFLSQKALETIQNGMVLSLSDVFGKFFSTEEFNTFRRCFTKYTEVVNEYLGFSVVKNLTSVAQANFARIVQHKLGTFDYSELIKIKMHEKSLFVNSYKDIYKNYFDANLYLIMLGNNDFAESLITAEWMYDSMKEAKAIDLTVIGMGYLKSIEQLLYSVVLLHKNEGRTIKGNGRNTPVPLDDAHITADAIDSTIGSIAKFYKDNQDVFRSTLPLKAKKYVVESIFVFKDIRNKYFHKQNIRDWSKINEIRKITYFLAFLLLGSAELTELYKNKLGFPQGDFTSEKYKLCEYINYHAGDHFFLCFGEGKEILVVAQRDDKAHSTSGLFMCYSGAYFSQFGGPARDVFSNMPNEIYLARMDVSTSEGLQFIPHKVRKIYADGMFIGPSFLEEGGVQY